MKKNLLLLILVGFSMTACVKRPLKARLESITPAYRASSVVGTPDPLKACFCGQQVVVSWKVPKTCKHLTLFLSYITGNHKFERVQLPIDNYRGAISYRMVNQDYFCRKGILTYKVELYSQGELISCFKPRSWVEWVDVDD